MRDWGKILVGGRLEKMVESQFFRVWSQLITQGLRPGDRWSVTEGMVAHRAANRLVRELLSSDCDSLFFVDSDAILDSQDLERLRTHEPGFEFDALQCFYTRRGWPPEAIWFQRDAEGNLQKCIVLDEATEEVAIVGLHATLVRRKVFETMLGDHEPDTFDWFYYPQNTLETEDAAFSFAAIAHGFHLAATTHVKAGHLGHLQTGWESYQEYLLTSGKLEQLMKHYQALEAGQEVEI